VRRSRGTRPRLTLVSGVGESGRVRFTDEYRNYFQTLGRSIGRESHAAPIAGHLTKAINVGAGITDAVDAAPLDIVVDRLERRFDLVVVTNVFPYLTDADLALALANIGLMLAPGGVLLHNEARPLAGAAARAAGLSLIHSRTAVVATVEGGRSPLYDAIWLLRAR
jgi:SAM-dependent methyltransferase